MEPMNVTPARDEASAEPLVITDRPDQMRYEALDPGTDRIVGWIQYGIEGDVMVIRSTNTLPEFRGRGVASQLTRRVLDDAVDAGRQVDALCWYVSEFIERNPKYLSLLV